ncbi:MAG: hypothetical protein A3I61_18745 [Acidobacteria bacterium RIFCSPLOWO2_02_FULL_68_18]|nr:MAG: hypothetical protein A3I61_18745 [Acidobacteria bacterium RIFCSPLOWO2_02_FULL_68_18]OFW48082.1 MAG: hypothetical protein A3G77_11355 [Acidobacteria bacterium RIFCSPLOWO2_12_FULL_68_19]
MDFLAAIEESGLATWVRESPSIFAYATVLAIHTFGLALIVGLSGAVGLRTLGFAPGVSLSALGRFFPLMWVGFWLNFASGLVLVAIDARVFLTMPTFYIKMLAIALALTTLRLLRKEVVGPEGTDDATATASAKGKLLAGALLLFWLTAVTSGRVTAYDAYIGRQTAGAVLVLGVLLLLGGQIGARVLRGGTGNERSTMSTIPSRR